MRICDFQSQNFLAKQKQFRDKLNSKIRVFRIRGNLVCSIRVIQLTKVRKFQKEIGVSLILPKQQRINWLLIVWIKALHYTYYGLFHIIKCINFFYSMYHFLDAGAKIRELFGVFFWEFKTPQFPSEIFWPLVTSKNVWCFFKFL